MYHQDDVFNMPSHGLIFCRHMLILKSAPVTHAYHGNTVNYLLDVGFVLDLNFPDYSRPTLFGADMNSLSIVSFFLPT